MVALVVAAAMAGAIAACGTTESAVPDDETPGFVRDGRPVDTTPFEPVGRGLRTGTLPNSFFEQDRSLVTTPEVPSPTQATSTTLPPPPPDDEVCRALHIWIVTIQNYTLMESNAVQFAILASRSVGDMAELISSAETPAFDPAAELFAQAAADLATATTEEEITDVILPIITEEEPAIVAALTPLRLHTERTCINLVAAVR